ncbi:Yip1 family protein [Paenibacillus oceani]|uniref:YIP1 family protein n=1 Tax=Paenibacillus oceani TaxID=2772510 RepID=A0A927C982_9BACL|nr:Yip1 family protein [Paenibacillus oceani]MBD2862056.1 YIP1 family protein [Paenibacillus oceani]
MNALNLQPDHNEAKRRRFPFRIPSVALFRASGYTPDLLSSGFWAQLARDVGYQLKQSLRVLKHPFEVFWEIRYRPEGSMWAAVLLLASGYSVHVLSQLATSYLFNPSGDDMVNPLTLLLQSLLPWVTWVFANYLIGSIMKGQGRWTEVFVGSAYALMPFLLLSLPLAILSNILTLNERVVYDFGNVAMVCWTLFLFFVMAKEIHNYDIGETVLNVVLSVLFMIAIWILLFILAGLTFQLYDFVSQIVKEVSYRG